MDLLALQICTDSKTLIMYLSYDELLGDVNYLAFGRLSSTNKCELGVTEKNKVVLARNNTYPRVTALGFIICLTIHKIMRMHNCHSCETISPVVHVYYHEGPNGM